MIRTRHNLISTLARAAAALPLGAFALGMLPFGTTHAAATVSVDFGMSASCADGNYHWLLSVTNEGTESVEVRYAVDGGESLTFTLGVGENQQPKVPSKEGFPSTVRLFINDVEYDSEATSGVVDCLYDGDVYATISIVCPEQGSNQDIYVDYEFGAPGTGAKVDYYTPDGAIYDAIISDEVVHRTHKVSQGDIIDVSAWDVTDGNKVLATFIDTVNCPTSAEEVPGDDSDSNDDAGGDNGADSEGSAGSLPDTGSETTLAWLAAAATLLGAGALRVSRREEELVSE